MVLVTTHIVPAKSVGEGLLIQSFLAGGWISIKLNLTKEMTYLDDDGWTDTKSV